MTIEEMKAVDIQTVDPDTLVDITQISIDENLPKEQRIREYIRQVKNPYCYKVNGIKLRKSHITENVVWDFFVKFYMNMY